MDKSMRNLACLLVVFNALAGFCPDPSPAQNAMPNLILHNGTIIENILFLVEI